MKKRGTFWAQWIEEGKGFIGYIAERHAANIFDESLPRRRVYKEDHERRMLNNKPISLKLKMH